MSTMAKLGRAAAREKCAAQPYTPMPMTGPSTIGMRFGTWLTNKMFGRGSTSPAPAQRGTPPVGEYTSPQKQTGPNRYKGKDYRPYPAYPGEPPRQ